MDRVSRSHGVLKINAAWQLQPLEKTGIVAMTSARPGSAPKSAQSGPPARAHKASGAGALRKRLELTN